MCDRRSTEVHSDQGQEAEEGARNHQLTSSVVGDEVEATAEVDRSYGIEVLSVPMAEVEVAASRPRPSSSS